MAATSRLLALLLGAATTGIACASALPGHHPRTSTNTNDRHAILSTSSATSTAVATASTARRRRCQQKACLARLRGGEAEEKVEGDCIGIDLGNRITPSYVAWTDDDQRLIGDAAKNQAAANPENTVFDAKRLIGRKFSDESVQNDIKHWPFKIADSGGKPKVVVTA